MKPGLRHSRGAIAPLAVLFTMLSLIYTLAYLSKATTQSRLEMYRFAEMKALLLAEEGLNSRALDEIAFVRGDTVLVEAKGGVYTGKDEQGIPFGKYRDVRIDPEIPPGRQRQVYTAYSTGVAEIKNFDGKIIEVERTVKAQFEPIGFEEFMYFTDKEEPSGPPNNVLNGFINFGANDSLEGRVHTNGNITLSNYGCPTFLGSVSISKTSSINFGGCDDGVFLDENGESIIDTIDAIVYPPGNPLDVLKSEATRIIEADTKLYLSGSRQDTMIMTEIEFMENGYQIKQWWYQVPPVMVPVTYPYNWDDVSANLEVMTGGVHLVSAGVDLHYNPDSMTYVNPTMVIFSDITGEGENIFDVYESLDPGDQILIESTVTNKRMSFTVGVGFSMSGDRHAFGVGSFNYSSSTNEGFLHNEPVEIKFLSLAGDLDTDVEFNAFEYFHDHPDDGVSQCRPDGFQHFDFPGYQNFADHEVMPPTFFQARSDYDIIYVKGGQVMIKGIVDGRYSVVTDDYIEYRRSDNNDIWDVVWGNIWLMDDIVYIDSAPNGAVIQPVDGGTENVLGLIAGGNIIVANTRANGAQNQLYGADIKINASMIAMHEAFLSHYWQNSINPGVCTGAECGDPIPSDPFNSRGDGRGRFRNSDIIPRGTTQDFRGTIYVWGSIVQQKRGYVKRNIVGPYMVNAPGIGYNKYYRYDYNLSENPPPHFPTLETVSGATVLSIKSYGELKED